MRFHVSSRGVGLLTALIVVTLWCGKAAQDVSALDAESAASKHKGFEVWIADQSDTRPGYGGQLLIYEGSDLMGRSAAKAEPIARLDLGAETAALCQASTSRNPVRPHMIAFNNERTHAVLSFVASGHVVIWSISSDRSATIRRRTWSIARRRGTGSSSRCADRGRSRAILTTRPAARPDSASSASPKAAAAVS